mmetsp:Transcript_16357/g.54765  ORF Transcript_16357/g.54765 Transcript_16357/m.54765 type:complete len:296 (-) Transcript_16357:1-888(-)
MEGVSMQGGNNGDGSFDGRANTARTSSDPLAVAYRSLQGPDDRRDGVETSMQGSSKDSPSVPQHVEVILGGGAGPRKDECCCALLLRQVVHLDDGIEGDKADLLVLVQHAQSFQQRVLQLVEVLLPHCSIDHEHGDFPLDLRGDRANGWLHVLNHGVSELPARLDRVSSLQILRLVDRPAEVACPSTRVGLHSDVEVPDCPARLATFSCLAKPPIAVVGGSKGGDDKAKGQASLGQAGPRRDGSACVPPMLVNCVSKNLLGRFGRHASCMLLRLQWSGGRWLRLGCWLDYWEHRP